MENTRLCRVLTVNQKEFTLDCAKIGLYQKILFRVFLRTEIWMKFYLYTVSKDTNRAQKCHGFLWRIFSRDDSVTNLTRSLKKFTPIFCVEF